MARKKRVVNLEMKGWTRRVEELAFLPAEDKHFIFILTVKNTLN